MKDLYRTARQMPEKTHTTHGERAIGSWRSLGWRTRAIIGFGLVVAILCAAGAWALFGPLSKAVIDMQRKDLLAIVKLDAQVLHISPDPLAQTVDELADESGVRVTIIAQDGTVMADSDTDPKTMQNHASRPEVQQALSTGEGSDQRISPTEHSEQLYVAYRTSYDGKKVIARVSTTVAQVAGVSSKARNTGLALLAVGFVISILVVWRTLAAASRPVQRLETVRTDFVANASHELKTPVAGIRLLSETVQMAASDGDLDTTRELAGRIDNEAEKLQHLMGDLLDLSRLEGEISDIQATTDVRSAVNETVSSYEPKFAQRGIGLSVVDTAPPADTCRVALSATDLKLIVDNLVANALAYTEKGRVTVTIVAGDRHVKLEVADTGIGIAREDQDRIFERFYRTDKARSRDTGGTGLGLALASHAARKAGGTIVVESELGQGSTFIVSLPRA